MKVAQIICIKGVGDAFAWKWRAGDGKESLHSFPYYYECLQDAEKHGYRAEFEGGNAANPDLIARARALNPQGEPPRGN